MAFNNGFNGDVVSLNYILQTLDAKLYNIPGVTSNENLTVTAMGETAYFYTRGKTTVDAAKVGDKITYEVTGAKRIDVPLLDALHIKSVLPRVNFATITADVVADKVIQETINQANQHNSLFLAALVEGAVEKTSAKGAEAYDKIVDAIKDFKVANKENALAPKAIFVSSAIYAELLKDVRFIRATALGDDILQNAIVGKVAGLSVVEAPELDADGIEFVILHPEGVAAPINVNSLEIVDATAIGYVGGTVIGGELGYGFKVVTKTEDDSIPTGGYLVAKYTEAV